MRTTGKSTIIKLLTRLYDVSSGEILVDGKNIKEYKLEDLRQATAILAQDHTIFPVSVSENVGLGLPSSVSDTTAIEEAIKKGGADRFIKRFNDGLDTELSTEISQYCSVSSIPGHPLQIEQNKLPKKINVSGMHFLFFCNSRVGLS
jgi:ABC-type multidrug transport system fused ATPase/permease subunit